MSFKNNISIITIFSIIVCALCYGYLSYYEPTVNNKFVAVLMTFFSILTVVLYLVIDNKIIRLSTSAVSAMFAFAFALVPLYNVFCDVTGLNGKVDLSVAAATPMGIDEERMITVEFDVSHNLSMPWDFSPKHKSIKVHPGQLFPTAYFAKNNTKKTMVAQAIPSITPSKASKYFRKVECFCFSSQKLGPGESANLGLTFYLDNDIPKDIHRLTLSYTIFDITSDAKEVSGHHA